MSFMLITCPWCRTNYTWGMVGSTIVGSGHKCEQDVPCDSAGCNEIARFLVADIYEPDGGAFSCFDHVGNRIISAYQPRLVAEEPVRLFP